VIEKNGRRIVAGIPGKLIVKRSDDIISLMEGCFENCTEALLIYPENITERFFDLKSGEAGNILQKLRNYKIRTAMVCPPGKIIFSNRFEEMMSEENRNPYFRIFHNYNNAENWLLNG
jgi:hypothetical protein